MSTNLANLLPRKLARKYDAFRPKLLPSRRRPPVHIVCLRADMDGQPGRRLPTQHKNAEIGNEHGVNTGIGEKAQILGQCVDILIVRKDVDGDIDLLPGRMRELNGRRNLVV